MTTAHILVSVLDSILVLFLVFGLPIASWRGWPRGFTRINWLGVAFLSGTIGGALAYLLADVVTPTKTFVWSYAIVGIIAGIFLAGALGAVAALFFWRRPGEH